MPRLELIVTRIFVVIGPSFAHGQGGKVKITEKGVTVSGKVNFGSGDRADYKPFDRGGNFLMALGLISGLKLPVYTSWD